MSGYGLLLENASEEFKSDREVVLAAVKNNGWALVYASDELRADRELVMAADQGVADEQHNLGFVSGMAKVSL